MIKKYFVIFFFLLLPNCSGYEIVSLTSNIITYAATGKSNSDHVASYVTGKDCKFLRVLQEEHYCSEKKLIIVENQIEKNEELALLDIVKNDSDLLKEEIKEKTFSEKIINIAYAEKVFDMFYYGSLTWAEYQLTRGTKVSDQIGLTDDLTSYVEETFENYFY